MRDLKVVVEVLFAGIVFFVYVLVLMQIVIDLFRDRELSGAKKALWVFGLLLFPFIAALLYLVTRGNGMAARYQAASERKRAEASAHIRELAGPASVDQISRAKTLLDQGAINNDEFVALKRGALAHVAR